MTINQRLFSTLEERKIKQKALADALNVKQQIVANWEKRGTNPPAEYISSIATFLDVSVMWLLTGDKENTTIPEDEKKLLTTYRQLDPRDRNEIQAIINLKLEQKKPEGIILNSKIG